jgi:serine/threonine protein phosphatase PrpC
MAVTTVGAPVVDRRRVRDVAVVLLALGWTIGWAANWQAPEDTPASSVVTLEFAADRLAALPPAGPPVVVTVTDTHLRRGVPPLPGLSPRYVVVWLPDTVVLDPDIVRSLGFADLFVVPPRVLVLSQADLPTVPIVRGDERSAAVEETRVHFYGTDEAARGRPGTRGRGHPAQLLLPVLLVGAVAVGLRRPVSVVRWTGPMLAPFGLLAGELDVVLRLLLAIGVGGSTLFLPRRRDLPSAPESGMHEASPGPGRGPVADGVRTGPLGESQWASTAPSRSSVVSAAAVVERVAPQHEAVGVTGRSGSSTRRPVLSLRRPVGEAAERPRPTGPWSPPVIGRPPRHGPTAAVMSGNGPADVEVDGGTAGNLVVRAATVRGRKHRVVGLPRQDAMLVRATPGGEAVVAAVADGLSSAAASHEGARLAVHFGVDQVLAGVTGVMSAPDVMHEVARVLRSSAGTSDPSLLATTLLVARIDAATGSAWMASVGDSTAKVLRDGVWVDCFPSAPGDIRDLAVACLPSHPDHVRERVVELQTGDVLVLMSDGLADPLGGGTGDVGAELARRWASPPEPLEYANVLDFRRRSFDDDRTAVAVWYSPGSKEGRR